MVFRFTPTQDCEMMHELIRLKPFAAERERTLDVWDKVAKSLSAALKSHYSDVDGLVRDYIELERLHQDAKAAKKLPKQRKEADLAQCAIDIVSESNRRRAHRQNDESGSDDMRKKAACLRRKVLHPRRHYGRPTSAHRPPKRSNAFLAKVKRQEKRYKEQMEMKVRELKQNQKQFDDRLAFEKEQVELGCNSKNKFR
ncbi:hypothetical protein PC121_g18094 [Phytophthora cactorum]|nr:hypothetical protein PC120_g18452 [Phytophthora cactorum]KAG3050996.1 hypothetical protein PC121_g18094 [Phytophthora cactorum]